MILVLMAVLVIWPAGVLAGVNYRVAGGTDYTVTFNSGVAVRQFSILAYSADIEVTLYLDSVALDTVMVLAGMTWEPTILCDAIGVDRSSATAVLVDWNEFLSRDVAAAHKSYAPPNPTSPLPVTTSQAVLISEWSTSAPTATTTNSVGSAVSGCRALLLDVEWDAGTTDFAVEVMFGMSAADSTINKFGVFWSDGVVPVTGIDTLAVDVSDYPDNHFTYQIPIEGSVAAGYLYNRLYAGSTMVGVTSTVFKVW